MDQATPFPLYRWTGFAALLLIFLIRIILAQGWYIVAYTLGIYLLNLFLLFLTPKFDPSLTGDQDFDELSTSTPLASSPDAAGPSILPLKSDDEFRPFIRRLPEFHFWFSATRASLIAIFTTCFDFFDIPVYWPILLIYFIVLFGITMRRQIKHMIKYKYVPFDLGKKTYAPVGGK